MTSTDPYKHATTTTLGGSIYSYSRVAGPTSEQLDIWEHAALLYHGYSWQEAKESFFRLAQTANDRQSYVRCILNVALIAARLGEYQDARDYAYAAAGADVTNAFAVLLSALMDWELGDLAKAKACLDACMRMLRLEGDVDYRSKGLDFTLRHNVVRALSGYVKDRLAENVPGQYAQTAPAIIPAECIFEAPERFGRRRKGAPRTPPPEGKGNGLNAKVEQIRNVDDTLGRLDVPPPLRPPDEEVRSKPSSREDDMHQRSFGAEKYHDYGRRDSNESYATEGHRNLKANQTLVVQPGERHTPVRPLMHVSNAPRTSRCSTCHGKPPRSSTRDPKLTATPTLPDIAYLSALDAKELQKQAAREAIEKLRWIAAWNRPTLASQEKEKPQGSVSSSLSFSRKNLSKERDKSRELRSANITNSLGFSITRTAPSPRLQRKKTHSSQESSARSNGRWRQRSESETIRIHAADLSRYLPSEHDGQPDLSAASTRDSKHTHTRSTSASAENSTKGRTLQRLKAVWRGHGEVNADLPLRRGKAPALALQAPPVFRKQRAIPRNARGSFGDPRGLAKYIRENGGLAHPHLQSPIIEELRPEPLSTLEASELAAFLANAARDRLCVDQKGGFSYDIAREDLLIGAPMPWANAATKANLLAAKRHSAPRRMESTMDHLLSSLNGGRPHGKTQAGYTAAKAPAAAPPKGFSILDHFRDDHDDETGSTSSLEMLIPAPLKVSKTPSPDLQIPSPEPTLQAQMLEASLPWHTHRRAPNPWAGLHTAASSSSDLFAGVNSFTERRNRAYDAALRMLEGRERMNAGAGGERKETLIRMSKMLFTPKADERPPRRMPARRRASVEGAAVIRVPTSQFFAFRC